MHKISSTWINSRVNTCDYGLSQNFEDPREFVNVFQAPTLRWWDVCQSRVICEYSRDFKCSPQIKVKMIDFGPTWQFIGIALNGSVLDAFAKQRKATIKKKRKGRLWVLQHCCLEAYCTLTRMSSFIHLQRRCTHQAASETYVSEGRNYTWNLVSNP